MPHRIFCRCFGGIEPTTKNEVFKAGKFPMPKRDLRTTIATSKERSTVAGFFQIKELSIPRIVNEVVGVMSDTIGGALP
ncbi:hypothetical protein AAE478_010270 [Parahypoxylon ruwenzoriense]